MARNEFRFVVDGVDLDDASRVRIAGEIQKAGLNALHIVNAKLVDPVTVGHANLTLRPEWYGLWILSGDSALTLGREINDLGFYNKL